jgi:hypothetical protein
MPCSPNLALRRGDIPGTGCKADCLHRRFVLDYVSARDEQARRAEDATGGWDTEVAEYFGSTGRPVEQRVTFQTWLRAHTGADYPYSLRPLAPDFLGESWRDELTG